MINTQNRVKTIEEALVELGEPTFRLKQIVQAIYQGTAPSYNEMTNLPKILRDELTQKLGKLLTLEPIKEERSEDTIKVLFKTDKGFLVESVLMTYGNHTTICISSHSGCPLGCEFCATGKMPNNTTLSIDEVCDQVLYFVKQNMRPDNIVIMGMGEPLINPDIFNILEIFTNKDYFGYGQRHISISTVGIVPMLKKLNEQFPQVNVAFSMHSPFDEEREGLMPINKAYPITQVFDALQKHVNINKRKIFVSYIMLKNVNDSDAHAEELAKLINNLGKNKYLFNVNLIKFHPFEKSKFEPSTPDKIKHFSILLKRLGVNNTIRKDFGEEIKGACGQLAGTND